MLQKLEAAPLPAGGGGDAARVVGGVPAEGVVEPDGGAGVVEPDGGAGVVGVAAATTLTDNFMPLLQ